MIAYLALTAATLTALALAWRERPHRPIAALLLGNLLASLVRTRIAPLIDGTQTGLWYFHVEEALYLVGPWSLAGVALAVLVRPRLAWGVAVAWAATFASLVARADDITADRLARSYLAIELVSLAVCAGAFARSRVDLRRLPHLALTLLVGVELIGVVLGPWRYGIWARWDLAQIGQVAVYGVLTLLQGGALVVDHKTRR